MYCCQVDVTPRLTLLASNPGKDSVARSVVDTLIVEGAVLPCSSDGPRRGEDLEDLEVIRDGAVAIHEGRIVGVGPTGELTGRFEANETVSVGGALVTPGLVDCHTHLVWGGSRHEEWEGLVTGHPPAGLVGGIHNTVQATNASTSAHLVRRAERDLGVMLEHGSTTVEAKSGYGLEPDSELRLLSCLAAVEHPVDLVRTYLCAHVLPASAADDRDGYVERMIGSLADGRQYADYCDVACDPSCFTVAECERIAQRALVLGYRIRVHADQTGDAGGAAFAARIGASSADHLDRVSTEGVAALAASDTVGVLFPTVNHHLLETVPGGQSPMLEDRPAWAAGLVRAGVALALSTDFNPGSAPCRSMQTAMQLAARLYRLSVPQIWHMVTINAAHALDRASAIGSLDVAKRADLVVWQVDEPGMVVHQFGTNLVDKVYVGGRLVVRGGRRGSY